MDDLEKIKNSDLTTVWSIFVASIKKKYQLTIILPTLLLILCAEISYLIGVPHPFFYCIALIFVAFAVFWQKNISEFLKHFATYMGYEYEDPHFLALGSYIGTVEGHLFTLGHSQKITKIVKGKFFEQDTRLFVFSATIGSGKNQHTENYSVLEISFNTLLPNILVRNKQGFLSFSSTNFIALDNEEELVLEGDFHKYFSLYVAKEYELEATQIFTPDVMQMFIDKAKDLSVEMLKNKIYLYYHREIVNKDQLVNIYSFAKDIIMKLEPTLEAIKDDVEHMQKYAKLT